MADSDEVAAALQLSVRHLLRRLRNLSSSEDLTLPETAALMRLDKDGPAAGADLARREQISPQSMGATLSGLERRGLVERSPDPDDGRRVLLAPSAAGLDLLRSKRYDRTALLAEALSVGFTDAELAQLRAASVLIERLAGEL
ncbi:MAG TPA: MarR family transcriptional regulator [Friedmanniella sp.]